MLDGFLNTNHIRLMLLEFIAEFRLINRWKESLILGYCNKSCDNLQYSLALCLWTKLTSIAQFKKGKIPIVWLAK